MINIKSIKLSKGNHVNKAHFIPTWQRQNCIMNYVWLDSLIKIEDDEEIEIGDSEFTGWWSYAHLNPIQSLAHHVLMVFDAYEIGYPLDHQDPNRPWSSSFSIHCLLTSRENERDEDNSFQAWCKIYDKKAFNKKKSYIEWQDYYETNIYAFRKICQLTYTLYQLLDFKSWEDMYNWCLDVYNEVEKVVSYSNIEIEED